MFLSLRFILMSQISHSIQKHNRVNLHQNISLFQRYLCIHVGMWVWVRVYVLLFEVNIGIFMPDSCFLNAWDWQHWPSTLVVGVKLLWNSNLNLKFLPLKKNPRPDKPLAKCMGYKLQPFLFITLVYTKKINPKYLNPQI